MERLINSVILSIGIFLGIIQPYTDPVLLCRVLRTVEDLYITLEIENGINESIEQLIYSSNRILVHITVTCGETIKKVFSHEIWYDPLIATFFISISETEMEYETKNKDAAYRIFLSYKKLVLCDLKIFINLEKKHININGQIEIQGIDNTDFDTGVLWNYITPEKSFTFQNITEIPY